jgi:hypothetical protein
MTRFASKREAARYSELRLLEKVGKIVGLRRQIPFDLVMKVKYVADFVYLEPCGGEYCKIVEDVKGYQTREFKRKKKLMLRQHNIALRIT